MTNAGIMSGGDQSVEMWRCVSEDHQPGVRTKGNLPTWSPVNCQPLLVAVYFAHNSQYLLQSRQKIKYFHLVEPDDGGLHLHGPPRGSDG